MNNLSCAYCGTKIGPFHDDHVVPRSRGGPDTPSNLVKACAGCNGSKGDLLPSEWRRILPPLVEQIERRVSAALSNKIRGRRDRQRKKLPIRECYFCGGQIFDPAEAALEFLDQEQGPPFFSETQVRLLPNGQQELRGGLCYPGHGQHHVRRGHWHESGGVAIVTHLDCGPDVGYSLLLSRLSNRANFEDLRDHVMTKPWAWSRIAESMAVVYEDMMRARRRSAFHDAEPSPVYGHHDVYTGDEESEEE